MASILFWSMKDADINAANEKMALGWKTLSDELPFCFPDILQKINESQWLNKSHSINLASIFPEQVRPLLETAVSNRKPLTSLFRHGGSPDERVLQTVIQTLEVIGNKESIHCLENLTEDPRFGNRRSERSTQYEVANNGHSPCIWNMDMIGGVRRAGTEILLATSFKIVDLQDEARIVDAVAWWTEMTAQGRAGMLVKPLNFIAEGRRGISQP
jgi:hypothetical protein